MTQEARWNRDYNARHALDRMKKSGRGLEKKHKDKLIDSTFDPSIPNTDEQAFIDEAQKIRNSGGLNNPDTYNQKNSPGEKILQKQGR